MIYTFKNVFGNGELHLKILKILSGETSGKTMVDLCCNHAPHTSILGFNERTYIDIQNRGLDIKSEQPNFVQADVLGVSGSYDVAFCIDGIEHFTKEDGKRLLVKMRELAPCQILFTPLVDLSVSENGSSPDQHLSGWVPEDVSDFGSFVFPSWHSQIGVGAFYFFSFPGLEEKWESLCRQVQGLVSSIMFSETAKYRALTEHFCQGCGIDIASHGDPVVPWAWQLELSPEEYANYNAGQKPVGPVQIRGHCENIPVDSGSLDFVYSSHILEDFPENQWNMILTEWVRILKPGGRMVILCPERTLWAAALAKGQPPNCSHRYEPVLGDFTRHAEQIGGLKVKVEKLTNLFEGDYSILFVAEKL